MNKQLRERSWATRLTPHGRGAVATLAVEGPHAAEDTQLRFHSASGKDLRQLPMGAIAFGCWADPRGEEVVILRTQRGVEIHCHGGAAATRAILESLAEAGVQIDSSGDHWLIDRDPGLIEQTARRAMAKATTLKAAVHLLAQHRGALRRELEGAADALQQGNAQEALPRIDTLLRYASHGLHLTKPWKVVLSGPPNVGKSSLINRIVGFQRAVVFDEPGTTRDIVSQHSPLDGWPVQWSDTAGIRDAIDDLEEQGVQRAQAALREADLVIRVSVTGQVSPKLPAREPAPRELLVINKIDLSPNELPQGDEHIGVSALTGEGLPNLLRTVSQQLIGTQPPAPQQPLLFTTEQVAAAQRCRTTISAGDTSAAIEEIGSMLQSNPPGSAPRRRRTRSPGPSEIRRPERDP